MAAPAIEAFGAYLRQLRERKSLSLDDVESLSSTFPDPVGKAYLSRCENGKLKIAFSKTIALSRVYEVPSEVLSERMRLDLEIDRLGGPDTTGMTFREMFKKASAESHEGSFWNAYAIYRDAQVDSGTEPLIEFVRDAQEQRLAARIALASTVSQVGASRLATFELSAIEPVSLGDHYRAIWLDRRHVMARTRGELEDARSLGEQALQIATAADLGRLIPPFRENMALTERAAGRLKKAIEIQQTAIRGYDDDLPKRDRIAAYIRLAEMYFEARRLSAARRTVDAVIPEIRSSKLTRTEAQALCVVGDVEWESRNAASAKKVWRRGYDLLRSHHDPRLKFSLQFRLYRLARETGDEASRRAIERRLRRLLPAIPRAMEEAVAFRRLCP